MLDVLFPDPQLGAPPDGSPGTTVGEVKHEDPRRGVQEVEVVTVLDDLESAPTDAYDAYLRLHLLSHRLVKPHGLSMEGIFGVLPNVAWTSHGPVDPAALPEVRMRFRGAGRAAGGPRRRQVPAHDRLRRAVGRADRRRLARAPRRPPRRGHDGDARGLRELQRRHARRLDGRGPDLGRRRGRRRLGHRRRQLDHGHAVGRRHRGHLDRRALPAGRQRRARDLARRRLHRRGRALRHRPARA